MSDSDHFPDHFLTAIVVNGQCQRHFVYFNDISAESGGIDGAAAASVVDIVFEPPDAIGAEEVERQVDEEDENSPD